MDTQRPLENRMKEIIDWLIRIEDFASRIYRETAAAFEDDRSIVDFFN